MDARTVADVKSWAPRSFDGHLGAVADRTFSGAVRVGDTYLFVVSGRPVGVFDYREDPMGDEPTVTPADLDAVRDHGDLFEAPHPALPLLYAMQATDGETRGRYYSNDTPLPEVDRTLRDGGFTGYVGLSENVLSGDYYLVYHGGQRRAVAFVGQSNRLKTDEEAFDLAAEEVGIYAVERAALPKLSWPDDVTGGAAGVGAGAGAAAGAGAGPAATAGKSGEPEPEPAPKSDQSDHDRIDIDITPRTRQSASGSESTADTASEPSPTTDPAPESEPERETESEPAEEPTPDPAPDHGTERDTPTEADPDPAPDHGTERDTPTEADPDPAPDYGTERDTPAAADPGTDDATDLTAAFVKVDEEGSATAGEPGGEASQADVAAATAAVDAEDAGLADPESEPEPEPEPEPVPKERTVPSVDPERTAHAAESDNESATATSSEEGEASDEAVEAAAEAAEGIVDGETVAGLRAELGERERELEARAEGLADLRDQLEESETEKAELRDRIAELERRLEAAGVAPEDAAQDLSPEEALAGMSLFVRYRSKRDPTLSDVPGGAQASAVRDNLRLEHHTTFDASEVAVDGRAFGAFLSKIQAHAFVRWLVEDLPYELRDTGNADSMRALYEALPALDRIEFRGEVNVGDGAATFDVVGRDRMGQPLVVANLEDVRDPMDEATLGTLVTDATALAEGQESLAGAFAVTSAYFEPAALETASEATSGSLLSRSKRKAFVKLSRNQGFHLALVEDREDSFYLSVPEL
jgi:hypothetical protein